MIDISAPAQLTSGRLATIVASRFVLNTIFRAAYPLIPFVAVRFAVPEARATWIVTIQVVFGLVSTLGGWFGERFGYRTTMLGGVALAIGGAIGVAVAPSLGLLIAAFGVCGVSVAIYQPAMQAYVSALTPYHGRGRAVGLVELSWALAGIAAVPPLMQLVQRQQSLTLPFSLVAFSLVAVFLLMLYMPAERIHVHAATQQPRTFRQALRDPSVRGFLLFLLLTIGGNEILFVAQPTWATQRFGASLADLGAASFVFGIGELLGSSTSALITDRLGKRRAAVLGFTLAAVVFVLLPIAGQSWLSYLAYYLLLAFAVEFGIVASLTLASTVSVVGRAAVMALTITVIQISRAVASQIGVPVLEASSIVVNSLLSALLLLIGVGVALRFVHEAERPTA